MTKLNTIPISPEFFEEAQAPARSRSIGAILEEAGRLTTAETETILQHQGKTKLRFGEAAIDLGFLDSGEVDFALSRQFDYVQLREGQSEISSEIFAAYAPSGWHAEVLRGLRGALLQTHFGKGRICRPLAVASPGRGEGRSFIAANLAVMFAQLGKRTLLIDADLRNPRQHQLFATDNRSGLSDILSARGSTESIQQITPLPDLSLLPAGAIPPNPAELLGRPMLALLLGELARQYDIILIDTAAGAQYTDAQSVAATAGAAMIVARDHMSRVSEMHLLLDEFDQARVSVVGSVLNAF